MVLAGDGRIVTLDAATGEKLDEAEPGGFLRLHEGADGRTVYVTDGDEILDYDTALHVMPHGDHNHYYAGDPSLTGISHEVKKAGHTVNHDGLTALFSDGAGEAVIISADQAAAGKAEEEPEVIEADAPHHGVAVPLADGGAVMTNGTEEERTEVRHVDADGEVLAETDECPGVHGAAVAADGRILFGCQDGPVIFDGEGFQKVDAPDEHARSGSPKGSADSPIVLADYSTADPEDEDADPSTQVALVDTRDASLKKVDLGAAYWFRSLARGPEGEALVLTDDGKVRIIDAETGSETATVKAIDPWEEKEDWQEPGPILQVVGDVAYVTDAERQELVLIDLKTNEVTARHELDFAPVEMVISDGRTEKGLTGGVTDDPHAGHDHEGHGHGEDSEGHDHEGHGHSHEGHDHGGESEAHSH